MTPKAREEALAAAKKWHSSVGHSKAGSVKNALADIFERHGENPRTAWTNACEVYAEVFGS